MSENPLARRTEANIERLNPASIPKPDMTPDQEKKARGYMNRLAISPKPDMWKDEHVYEAMGLALAIVYFTFAEPHSKTERDNVVDGLVSLGKVYNERRAHQNRHWPEVQLEMGSALKALKIREALDNAFIQTLSGLLGTLSNLANEMAKGATVLLADSRKKLPAPIKPTLSLGDAGATWEERNNKLRELYRKLEGPNTDRGK